MKSRNKMLKCQFHVHANGDPVDHIKYSPKELIDEAARLKFDTLSITCHRKILFTKNLQTYAGKKGILLIPGIEFEIDKKHILCINAHEEIYEIKTFEDLRAYRKNHPECFFIAPHPFFPGPSLKHRLEKNIDCFDAIELSWAYTKTKDYNKKAVLLAQKHQIPLITTSDCHILKNLNRAYCMVNCEKNSQSIFTALKAGRFKNHHTPTNIFRILQSLGSVILATMLKRAIIKTTSSKQANATIPQKNSDTGAEKSTKNCTAGKR